MATPKQVLRAAGCYNAHRFMGGETRAEQVYVDYHARGGHRDVIGPRWVVGRIDADGTALVTDSLASWYDYGQKTFPVRGRADKKAQLERALAWAGEEYGIASWTRTPLGFYADAEFVKARLVVLVAQGRGNLKLIAEGIASFEALGPRGALEAVENPMARLRLAERMMADVNADLYERGDELRPVLSALTAHADQAARAVTIHRR